MEATMRKRRFGKISIGSSRGAQKYLRRRDVAKALRVTTRTISRWEAEKTIPSAIRIGRTPYWLTEDVENFIAAKIAERDADR